MNIFKKISALFLSAALFVTASSFESFAVTAMDMPVYATLIREESSEYGYRASYWVDEDGGVIKHNLVSASKTATALPSSYSLIDKGRSTSVKDQGQEGLCWAYAGIASIESNAITKGLANNKIDYSEKHLAWFTNGASPTSTADPMYGDGYSLGLTAYNTGGSDSDVIPTMARWSGAVLETTVPGSTKTALSESLRYSSVLHVQNADFFDPSDLSSIKNAIINNGAVTIGYYSSNSSYKKTSTYTSYYQTSDVDANHAVTVVGWDDNFSKSNFNVAPKANGAWLIKNSWGDDWGTANGYFWLSYYEPSIDELVSYDVESTSNYSKVYSYDGSFCERYVGYPNSNYYLACANVFTASDSLPLKAVSIKTLDADVDYTVKIYTDVITSPSTGTLVHTQKGNFEYKGYHTIDLSKSIALTTGKKFAVEFSFADATQGIPLDTYSNVDKSSYMTYGTSASNAYCVEETNGDYAIKAFTGGSLSFVPALTGSAKTNGSVSLSWTTNASASKYRIQRKLVSGTSWSTIAYSTSSTYTDTNVVQGTAYSYRVLAYCGSAWCAPSNAVSATPNCKLSAPVISASVGDKTVNLSWNAVSGAVKYRVQRKTGTDQWSSVSYPTTNSYKDTAVTNGTLYSYRVLAYSGVVYSVASNAVAVTPTITYPTLTLAASFSGSSAKLSWNAVTNATKYRIQRSIDNGAWVSVAYPTTTSYNDTMSGGASYRYRVLAYVNSAWGTVSNIVSSSSVTVAVPELSGTIGNGSVKLSWTTVSGATKYRVQRKTGSGVWISITYPTTNSYVDTDVINGTTYAYRVLAYVNGAWGTASGAVTALPSAAITTPTIKVSVSGGTATLTWQAVTGATKYRLQRRNGTGSWITISYTTGLKYSDASLASGTYSYRILAYVNDAIQPASAAVTVTL